MRWRNVAYGRYVAASKHPETLYIIARRGSGSKPWRLVTMVGTDVVESSDHRTVGEGKTAAGKNDRRNPSVLALVNPPAPILCADAVYEIAYRHADDGEDYVHEFTNPESVKLAEESDRRVLLFGDGMDILDTFEV